MPPWTQSRLACAARFACCWVRVIVVAPAMLRPVSLPYLSSSRVEAAVVADPLTPVTTERFSGLPVW